MQEGSILTFNVSFKNTVEHKCKSYFWQCMMDLFSMKTLIKQTPKKQYKKHSKHLQELFKSSHSDTEILAKFQLDNSYKLYLLVLQTQYPLGLYSAKAIYIFKILLTLSHVKQHLQINYSTSHISVNESVIISQKYDYRLRRISCIVSAI